jgi:hypothetical protein
MLGLKDEPVDASLKLIKVYLQLIVRAYASLKEYLSKPVCYPEQAIFRLFVLNAYHNGPLCYLLSMLKIILSLAGGKMRYDKTGKQSFHAAKKPDKISDGGGQSYIAK